MEKDEYCFYRCFIIPISNQFKIFNELTKEERFLQIFNDLISSKKQCFQYWKIKHIIYFDKACKNRLYVMQYAKEIISKKKERGREKY
jgi:hypothetical protein